MPANDDVAECNRGMVELGNRFAGGDCFLPDLMFAGMIMKGVMAELAPLLTKGQAAKSRGTVVMGSVAAQRPQHRQGHRHHHAPRRGLRGGGPGRGRAPEKFVEAITRHNPQVVGMSVLLTTCFKSVIATVEAIKQAGQRQRVSVMVGGAAASDLLRRSAGCDFYGRSAVNGVKFAGTAVGAV